MFQRNKITSSLLKKIIFKPGSRGFIVFFLKKKSKITHLTLKAKIL